MALVKPVIFQVVGYQNSGKTTFILKLIQALNKQGIRTATIKHHGHGGQPQEMNEKDSTRHLAAGALASIVEGDGRMILQVEKSSLSLENQIAILEHLEPDVILIEGHKHIEYPKLLILRDNEDLPLLFSLKNIKAIIYWTEELKNFFEENSKIPHFLIQDSSAILWVTAFLKNDTNPHSIIKSAE